jgi:hypothetical protein
MKGAIILAGPKTDHMLHRVAMKKAVVGLNVRVELSSCSSHCSVTCAQTLVKPLRPAVSDQITHSLVSLSVRPPHVWVAPASAHAKRAHYPAIPAARPHTRRPVIAPHRCPFGNGGDEEGAAVGSGSALDRRATSDPRFPGATLPAPRRIGLEALGQPPVRDGGGG